VNTPARRTSTITRHEWVIGSGSQPMDAKEFTYGINVAQQEMESLGVNMSYDDCYHVRAGDAGEVILYVEIEGEPQ
jgi:hypothetical protein